MPSHPDHTAQYLHDLHRRGGSEQTVDSYSRILADYNAWLAARALCIVDVQAQDFVDFQTYLANGPRGRPLSAGRRGLYAAVLRSFYRYLIHEELARPAVLKWIVYPKQPRRIRDDALTQEQLAKYLATADHTGGWPALAIRLMALSGLRVGEVCQLDLADLNLRQREIIIRQAKGNKQRLVFIDKTTRPKLALYLQSPRPPSADPLPLLINRHGIRLTKDQVYGHTKRLALQAGLRTPVSPHSLRRTFATRMLASGVKGMNLKIVAELLGHAKLRTTAKYAQVDQVTLQRVYAQSHPIAHAA